jgi:hypothetical protein
MVLALDPTQRSDSVPSIITRHNRMERKCVVGQINVPGRHVDRFGLIGLVW